MDNLIDFNTSFGEAEKEPELQKPEIPLFGGFVEELGAEASKNNNPFDEIEKKAYLFDDPFENPCIRQTPAKQLTHFSRSPENILVSVNENSNLCRRSQSLSDEEKIQDVNAKKERSHSLELKSKNNELLKLSLLNAQQKRESLSESPLSESLTKKLSFRKKSAASSNSDSFEDINSIDPDWIDNSFARELEQMKVIDIKTEPQTSPISPKTADILKLSDIKKENLENLVVKEEKPEAEEGSESSEENVQKMLSNLRQAISESKQIKAVELLDNLTKVLKNRSGSSSESHSPNNSTEIQDNNLLTVPNPIIRQDTFDIDDITKDKDQNQEQSQEDCQMEESSQDEVEPVAAQSNFVEQLSKFLVNSNLSVLHSNQADSSTVQPTYIVVVPPSAAPPLNQSQAQTRNKVRRSMSLSLDKKPQSVVEAAKKRESTLATTPAKTKASSLSRRSSFSNAQQLTKVSRPSLAIPGSARKPNEYRRTPESPSLPRKFGDNSNIPKNNVKGLSIVPKNNDIAEKNLRPEFGGVKKASGPMKAIPIPLPQLNFGAKNLNNENVNAKASGPSRLSMQPNYSGKLMPKSPSLIKRNSRLSFATPQPQSKNFGTNLPTSVDPSRTRARSYAAGKKQLLNEF